MVRNALAQKALFQENRFLRRELRDKYRFENIIGKSDAIEQVFRIMEKVARTDSSVLITGESGTGKELVARAIHFTSERANARFLPINCGAMPENLLESELFGYKRGAFTGAAQDKLGPAQGGRQGHDLFDEIGEMPLALQVKLLRALQERECYPLGSNEPVSFDVRVLCATNRDLEREVKEGRFREELLYRINVITITLPAAARAPRGHPAARQSFPAQVRKAARARPRCAFPRARCACWSVTRGRATCASWKTASSAPPSWPRPTSFTLTTCPTSCATSSVATAGLDDGSGMTLEELEREHIRRVLAPVQGDKVSAAEVVGHPSLDALPQGPALPAGERGRGRRPAQPAATARRADMDGNSRSWTAVTIRGLRGARTAGSNRHRHAIDF